MITTNPTIGYYSVLGLERDPFSTSPDPDFFYHTQQHDSALTNLLIELRLRRGLSVIFGDVGTGKTTLSRKLVHELNKRSDMLFHMILNPSFSSERQFLQSLIKNFRVPVDKRTKIDQLDDMELRDIVEQFLIENTINEHRTVILIVDEAQKLDLATLESLRILLNFETNDHKLIQLVLLGQLELYSKVVHMSNFLDRISFKFTLNPLDVVETKELIEFRINRAGYKGQKNLFDHEAISAVYNFTRGYPRKINMLCHKILKQLILKNEQVVTFELVSEVVEKEKRILSTGKNEPLTF